MLVFCCRSIQAEAVGATFVSTEIKVPVFSKEVAMWMASNPMAHFLFSTGCSTALFGLSNCPRLWVPALLFTGEISVRTIALLISSRPTLYCLRFSDLLAGPGYVGPCESRKEAEHSLGFRVGSGTVGGSACCDDKGMVLEPHRAPDAALQLIASNTLRQRHMY